MILRHEQVDATGLRIFRALFGLIMAVSVVRLWAYGWIESQYIQPGYYFAYLGFESVKPWASSTAVYVHFAALFASALTMASGRAPRLSAAVFAVLFTTVELWDKATYLNHYVFVSLIAVLLAVVGPTRERVSSLAYTVLRFQVGVVYFFAGLAKLNADWLLRGEPLATWLAPHVGWADVTPVAIAMSWCGAIFDLTIWAFMLHPKTRKPAFWVAVFFHLTVWALFPIGIFSFVMIASLTVFFAPDWPRRVALPRKSTTPPKLALAAFAVWALVQVVVPLRYLASPHDPNWTEDSFRFAWRVMLIEKVGTISFAVKTGDGTKRITPRDALTPQQYKQMSTQPDMIVQYAHHLSAEHGGAPVFAESFVAYNGRRSQRYLPADVDLARLSPWDANSLVLPLRQ